METRLRAGAAIYNAGGYHAAHDAWEDRWLELASGTRDERFLHGLIQFTAAVYHARNRNWSGAIGLAGSAVSYLTDLPPRYRGVNLSDVCCYLRALESDPEMIERRRPLYLTHEGDMVRFRDLGFEATTIVAPILGNEYGFEQELLTRAIEYARSDLDAGITASPFVTLLFDFVRDADNREVVLTRLSEHVQRRTGREKDVSGLFERRD